MAARCPARAASSGRRGTSQLDRAGSGQLSIPITVTSGRQLTWAQLDAELPGRPDLVAIGIPHRSFSRLFLEYGHNLTLRISDNGVGIDAAVIETGKEGHFGLRGIRERSERIGAKFTLVSGPATGTAITLIVPGRIAFRLG